MTPLEARQPGSDGPGRRVGLTPFRRFLLIFGVLLLLGYGGYSMFQRWSHNRLDDDPALAAELQGARLIESSEPTTSPGDWPQWRGPKRDGVSLETALEFAWADAGPKMLWDAKAGEGYSSFAVASGRVYTILQEEENEAIVCWDAEMGQEKWRFRYPAHLVNRWGSGPRSTPTIDGDRVYTVGGTGVFHCLNAATGTKVWRHDLLEEFNAKNLTWGVAYSPLIEGNLVLTNPGGPDGKSIVAFDKISGDIAWKAYDDSASYSSPIAVDAAGRRQLIFFTGSGVVGLTPAEGKTLWNFPWKNGTDVNAATPIAFSARIGETVNDYVFVSCGYGKGCCLLKLIPAGDGVDALRVYETARMGNHFSTCVRLGEQLYGFDESHLTCMDLLTGKIRWKQGRFGKGSLTIADGRLVIMGESGRLAVADATPDEYRETASFQFSENKCWTVPVIANGRLYLRDEQRIVCYDLRK
jgi:outer membrane protein assembly factor BamB